MRKCGACPPECRRGAYFGWPSPHNVHLRSQEGCMVLPLCEAGLAPTMIWFGTLSRSRRSASKRSQSPAIAYLLEVHH